MNSDWIKISMLREIEQIQLDSILRYLIMCMNKVRLMLIILQNKVSEQTLLTTMIIVLRT